VEDEIIMKTTILKWLITVIILVGIVLGMRFYMRSFAEQALAPITDSTQALRTQVAQVLHQTPTIIPDPITIINEVRSLARLETIQYSVEKIITAESGQEALKTLFGDRLLFVAHGIVIAGLDLNQMEPADLELRDGILTVNLPDAEIFIATLDNDKSYVYDRQTGLLTKGEQDLETLARQAAEQEIHHAALEDGILEQAAENAKVYLTRLFGTLGYDEVLFE
jgi:hypothetical protein